MKKILYAILLALTIPFSVFAQFSKMSNAEKIGSYDLGNYHYTKQQHPKELHIILICGTENIPPNAFCL